MPIASKLVYFQRRPSPAPLDPGPEPPDPRRRPGRDASSARQRRRSSLSSLHKPGQEPVSGNQRESTKCLGPTGKIAEHVGGTSISSCARLNRSVSDHGRLPDAVQQARERLLQRLNSVDLSGRRQKTCPAETTWAGLARPSDFSSDCILGTLTNCFQPGDSIAACKIEEGGTTEEPVCSNVNVDDCTPVPELERSACSGRTEEGEVDNRGCEPPASECSICLERCAGGGTEDGLTRLHCGHVFHSACLDRWLLSRGDCPYCRATVLRP